MAILAFGVVPYSVSAVCRKWSPDGKVPLDMSAVLYFDSDKDRMCELNCSFMGAFRQTFSFSTRAATPDGKDKVSVCICL